MNYPTILSQLAGGAGILGGCSCLSKSPCRKVHIYIVLRYIYMSIEQPSPRGTMNENSVSGAKASMHKLLRIVCIFHTAPLSSYFREPRAFLG